MSLVDLGKSLLEAAKQGRTEEVRTLMSNGAPFTTDWLGTSPLHFAAFGGHVKTAEVLLRAGISRDARTKVDRTPLHVAAQEGHHDVVDLLIKNGADIEAKDMLKMSPLHWAVEKGHITVIELFLGHGADIHCHNKFDKTPVDIASSNGRSDLAELLQLSRVPQSNVVEVTAEQTVIEEIATEPNIAEEITTETLPTVIKTENGDSGEQSSTAVLATLAALAEASEPINIVSSSANTSAAEALSWLEKHGISMISGDTATELAESGQSLRLTEAGKLALNHLVRKQGIGEDGTELTENMITLVTDDTGDGSGQVILKLSQANDDDGEPTAKSLKVEEEELDSSGLIIPTSDSDGINISEVMTSAANHIVASVASDAGDIITMPIVEETVAEESGVYTTENLLVPEAGGVEGRLGVVEEVDIGVDSGSMSVVQGHIIDTGNSSSYSEELQVEQQPEDSNQEEEYRERLDEIASKT